MRGEESISEAGVSMRIMRSGVGVSEMLNYEFETEARRWPVFQNLSQC
jgi:hypothetical protein